MNKEEAYEFAREWIDAWNSHRLDRVLSHYEDDFEMSSPAIIRMEGEVSGMLKGKKAIGNYWAKALEKFPELEFELQQVLWGANSVVLVYKGVLGVAAEVFHFAASGKVTRAFAHYDV